ncbi:MAG: helicase-related protein [Thomasclavelia ramosa]
MIQKEERHRLVNQFQNDDTTVFLISLKAGGTGLNLTAAEAVIHLILGGICQHKIRRLIVLIESGKKML